MESRAANPLGVASALYVQNRATKWSLRSPTRFHVPHAVLARAAAIKSGCPLPPRRARMRYSLELAVPGVADAVRAVTEHAALRISSDHRQPGQNLFQFVLLPGSAVAMLVCSAEALWATAR